MVEVGDHCGSQGDRKFYIRVKGYIWGMHLPCAHGCHRILPNCQVAAPAAARERLHPLGNPYISRREIARRFQPSHRRRPSPHRGRPPGGRLPMDNTRPRTSIWARIGRGHLLRHLRCCPQRNCRLQGHYRLELQPSRRRSRVEKQNPRPSLAQQL